MKGVLVDTCVWSSALRGNPDEDQEIILKLNRLIDGNQVKIIGPIKQELLSGYSEKRKYEKLKQKIQYFPNYSILDIDYEAAAEYSNLCRSKGIQGSHTDFLICAVAIRAEFLIYTIDRDFEYYSQHLPLKFFG